MFLSSIISDYPILRISENEQKTVYLGGDVKTVCLGEDVDLAYDIDSNPLSTLSWHNQTSVIESMKQTIKCLKSFKSQNKSLQKFDIRHNTYARLVLMH
jgi:hypothetical protein